MTRLQAKEKLIELGIEEPTDEIVSNYLNQIGAETKKEKDRAERYKEDSEKVVELQKQLDELNNQNLSDVEKANKATEEANAKVTALENKVKEMQIKNGLAEQGIVGEQADKLIESLNGGSFDASILGQIIADREKSAVAEHEKKTLESTPNPDGSTGDEGGKKTEAEVVAESVAKSLGGSGKDSAGIIDAYK